MGAGFRLLNHLNGDGNAAALERSIGGLIMGGDAAITDDFAIGLMGGYSRSGLDVSDRASSATIDSYMLGAYAGGTWDAFSLKGGLAHCWHSIDTSRSVALGSFRTALRPPTMPGPCKPGAKSPTASRQCRPVRTLRQHRPCDR